jgi:SAM-dependent methyltransferase
MRLDFLKMLVCPRHKSELDLSILNRAGENIVSGELICKSNGCRYEIRKSIPRFVDSDDYADSFSKQRLYVRQHFDDYRHDRSGDRILEPSTGFNKEILQNGVTLEVGCGYGRFLDTIDRMGGRAVGVDLSTHSIELAGDFVGDRPNIDLVQADLYQLPFKENSFERVFSWGVLHHTPSTRDSFKAIVPYAKPGGMVSIWVYPPEMKKTADVYRIITKRLPQGVLYNLCITNQVLFSWIRALPGGWRFSRLIPGAQPKKGQTFWQRVLSDFDNLSPTYAFSHSAEEVQKWFTQEGLNDVRILERATSVTGVKPS